MLNIQLYDKISDRLSREITEQYSTSFSAATSLLGEEQRQAIYAIYGFVRVADEIVDSWRPKDMGFYLDNLKHDVKRATQSGFSPNPVVHSFARAVRKYNIPQELTEAFMRSMAMDINKKTYTAKDYQTYIYGSAEVVGLMCLMVFVGGNKRKYAQLLSGAKALGAAFQKINFLRDLSADSAKLGRMYFPGKDFKKFSEEDKQSIINDISSDLAEAKKAIKKLPKSSRYGVKLAYLNFYYLTKLARKTPAGELKKSRISLSKTKKISIFLWVKLSSVF